MFQTMRRVFGPITIGLIIGAIAIVFVMTGAFDVLGTRFGSGGGYAAMVNGDSISLNDFNREYQSRLEYFQSMMQGKVDPKFLKQLGIEKQVLEDLIRKQVMLQQANKLNLIVSDEELRDRIQELPYFKKDGKFDAQYYRQLLLANGQQPARFEERVREDLVRAKFADLLRAMARVSESEAKLEFLSREDKRSVSYVLVSSTYGRDRISVSAKEKEDFLKTEAGLNTAKQHYEQYKFLYAKKGSKPQLAKPGQTPPAQEYEPFENVKLKIAENLLKDRKGDEATKLTRATAEGLFAALKGKNLAEIKTVAKAKGFDLKVSEKFSREQGPIPGIGVVPDLVRDAFATPSPLKSEARLYETRGSYVIAFTPTTFTPDLTKFGKEREQLIESLAQKKHQALIEQWITDARQKASIKVNPALVQQDAG